MAEYIEREATVKLLRSLGSRDYRREKGTIQEAIKMVSFSEYTPAADVAPVRHAKWGVEVGMNFFKERNCPVCKKRIESNFWNYCPNCGCRMDGGAD